MPEVLLFVTIHPKANYTIRIAFIYFLHYLFIHPPVSWPLLSLLTDSYPTIPAHSI